MFVFQCIFIKSRKIAIIYSVIEIFITKHLYLIIFLHIKTINYNAIF